ncbi:four helix bundle protein [Kosmotoga sp. DU53]|uniref:four helix bundle protein n=1 Tax=Kosmotoga sp. DU53 TaxID=1310160 RepID=UPI0007C59646|nr:four helix bundle protein [Kosmotoga sp. DU53]
MDLAAKVYEITDKFPKHEMYSLADQMRRAAVSIPSNIAEGKGRRTTKDFIRFLNIAKIAKGSLYELQTQCILSNKIGYLSQEDFRLIIKMCETLEHRLSALIKYLKHAN